MTTTERAALDRINRRQNAANLFTNIGPAEIAAEAATVAAIIRRHGGNRERAIMEAPHTMEHGETWNDAHKVIEVLETAEGPDGYRAGFAVDIATRSIVG